jgi:putative ABC transport system substrate-binding protein
VTTRRTLLQAVLASIALASVASHVQGQTRPRRIGFLWEAEQSDYVQRFEAFKAGMRELGYAEGRDYTIEHRSAQNDLARLPALAAELVALKVDLIFASSTPPAVAAHKVTREIPILFRPLAIRSAVVSPPL